MLVPADVAELGVKLSQRCFDYPAQPSGRRHGPQGYLYYEAYRDWLRDEFAYRCGYCLMRESWLRGKSGFQIDHCVPPDRDPNVLVDYNNLVYTCPWCNRAKSGIPVPNPTEVAYGRLLEVNEDGIIQAKSALGSILIEGLRLDHQEITEQRRLVLRVVRLAEEKNNVAIVLKLLGCPDDLPNLRLKRPPKVNSRVRGIDESWYEKRRRRELPLIY